MKHELNVVQFEQPESKQGALQVKPGKLLLPVDVRCHVRKFSLPVTSHPGRPHDLHVSALSPTALVCLISSGFSSLFLQLLALAHNEREYKGAVQDSVAAPASRTYSQSSKPPSLI